MTMTPVGRAPDAYGYDLARSDPRGPGRLGEGSGPRPRKPPRRWARRLLWSLAFTVLVVLAVIVYVRAIGPMGVGTSLVALTAALVPVSLVLLVVWWLDRYTPQPRVTLVFAFAWGAAASVALTLFLGERFQGILLADVTEESVATFLNTVVQAPVVEESMKSAGPLVLAASAAGSSPDLSTASSTPPSWRAASPSPRTSSTSGTRSSRRRRRGRRRCSGRPSSCVGSSRPSRT